MEWILNGAVGLLFAASQALAQVTVGEVRMDNFDGIPDAGRPTVEYLLAGVFLVATLALGVMSSKRAKVD